MVRVRSDLVPNKFYGGETFADGMKKLLGVVVRIREVYHGVQRYEINGNGYLWSGEMLDPVAIVPRTETRKTMRRLGELEVIMPNSPISRAAKDITREQEERFKHGFVWDSGERLHDRYVQRWIGALGLYDMREKEKFESRKEIRKRLLKL